MLFTEKSVLNYLTSTDREKTIYADIDNILPFTIKFDFGWCSEMLTVKPVDRSKVRIDTVGIKREFRIDDFLVQTLIRYVEEHMSLIKKTRNLSYKVKGTRYWKSLEFDHDPRFEIIGTVKYYGGTRYIDDVYMKVHDTNTIVQIDYNSSTRWIHDLLSSQINNE